MIRQRGVQRIVAYLLVPLSLLLLSTFPASASTTISISWVARSPAYFPVIYMVGVAAQGRVWVYNGALTSYDPATDTWGPHISCGVPTSMPTIAALNGKIYIIGGESSSGYIATTFEYDPTTDTCTQRASMNSARAHLASAVSNGKIYVFGGALWGWTVAPTVEEYDPGADSWTVVGTLQHPHWDATAGTASDGKIYIFGGTLGGGSTYNTVEAFDPISRTSVMKTPMPLGRSAHGMATVGDKMYLAGGFSPSAIEASVDVYDATTDTWTSATPMNTPRSIFPLVLADNGKLYAIGGCNGPSCGTWLSSMEEGTIGPLTIPLTVTTTSLPSGTVGVAYSATLEASGGTTPYSWSIISGELPPGLTLDTSSGVISGTPTTAGSFDFTVQVTDSTSTTVTKQISFTPAPSTGTAGSTYQLPISVAPPSTGSGGGSTPTCSNYAVTSGNLPTGLTIDPTTGVISGTPINGGTYNVTIQCIVSTGETATKSFTITINNPLPTITSLVPSSAFAGQPDFTLTVNGTNFITSSTVQWNGSPRPTTYVSATQLTAATSAADIATAGMASVNVVNPAPVGGTSNAATFTIILDNQPPKTMAQVSPTPISGWNNTAVTVSLSAIDNPGGSGVKQITYSGSGAQPISPTIVTGSSTQFPVQTEGITDLSYNATDNVGNTEGPNNLQIKIDETAPAVSNVVINPIPLGTNWSITVNANDPAGTNGAPPSGVATLTYTVDPGIPAATTGFWSITPAGSVQTTSPPLTGYAMTDVHTVCVTVTDLAGNVSPSLCALLAVYDPSAGFVTGGGWLNSPAGAFTADPTLTGRANFGFVSKYQKGANVPTGQTEFQFQAGSLSFHSDSYQWLVVSGPKAQYRGTGTLNGVSGYTFLLTATDGDQPGGGGVDKFRIKIWNSGGVVYDNSPGASDDLDQANPEAIAGGSIVIHSN